MRSVYPDGVVRARFLHELAFVQDSGEVFDVADIERAKERSVGAFEERIWRFVEQETGLETPEVIEIRPDLYTMQAPHERGFIVQLMAKTREELAYDYWRFRFRGVVEVYELATGLWRRAFRRQREAIITRYRRWIIWRERNLSDKTQCSS